MADNDPYLNEADKEQSTIGGVLASITAGLGVMALGQLIYAKTGKGNLIADILHFTGNTLRGKGVDLKYAANRAKTRITSGASAGARTILDTSIDVRSGGLRLDDLDIVKDLVYQARVIGAGSASDQVSALTELSKNAMSARYKQANVVSFFGQALERLTIGEVLADQKTFQQVIGKNSWDVIKSAADRNIIGKDYILDTRIFATSKGIRDTRLKPLGKSILNNIDFLGLSNVVRSVTIGADTRFAVLPGEKKGGVKFFIDGDIYSFFRDPETGILGKTKQDGKFILRNAGDPLQISSRLRSGEASVEDPAPTSLYNKVQAFFGVGTAYRNRDSLFTTLFINPIKRLASLESGEGIVYRKPYRKSTSAALEAFAGDVAPEAFDVDKYIPTSGKQLPSFSELGFMDRAKVMFGVHDELAIIKSDSYREKLRFKRTLTNNDLVVPRPTGNIKDVDTFFSATADGGIFDDAASYTGLGEKTNLRKSKFYATKDGFVNRVLDFANYTLTRLNSLASGSLAGVGFKVSGSIKTNAFRLAMVPVAYEAVKQTAGYLDYVSESTIGISPLKLIGELYASARVAQQKFREMTGIQQVMKTADEDFPGSVNSELGFFGRTLAAPFLTFMKGVKSGLGLKKAGLLAGVMEFLVGGSSPEQTSEELRKEYAGQKKVPVRRGALWGMGYQPFFGGDIQYYDYSWYYKMESDYKTKSLYGSREEYYSKYANVFGIPLPTPSNLFGIRNLFNNYALEEANYYRRPYQETAGMFDEFPIFGPVLSATVGELIKPTKKMHVSELYGLPAQTASLVDRTLPLNSASRLGVADLPVTEMLLQDPKDPLIRLQQQAAIASEPLGIYQFILTFLGVNLKYNKANDPASASVMGSVGRDIYDSNVGGLFGQTEFIRRFFPSEKYLASKQRQLYNPIRNVMPTWLPGMGSEEKSDQDYFMDFLHGDPYARLESGDSRLPGVGYEALNPLYSNMPGVYSDVDRFLILADVAPYSTAYQKYLSKVGNPEKYAPYWRDKLKAAIEQRDTIVNQLYQYDRIKPGINDLNNSIKQQGFYGTLQKGWDSITHDVLAEIPYFGSKFAPFRDAIERYQKEQIYGDSFADWNRPWETIVRPAIYDTARANPIYGAAKGAIIGALVSNAIPGAGGALFNPIVGLRNPSLAIPTFGAIGAALSLGRSAMTDQNFIPPHKQSEIEAQTYMDRTVYAKARSYEIMATDIGDKELASGYARQAGQTQVGATSRRGIKSSLNSFDRKYFDTFVNTPESSRKEILAKLPAYYGQALNKVWTDDYGTDRQHDIDTLEYFSNNAPLSNDSLLWHPSVPVSALKIKMIQGGINGVSDNLHRFGFYESQGIEAEARFPNVNYMTSSKITLPNFSSLKNDIQVNIRRLNPFADPATLSVRQVHSSVHNQSYEINQKIDRQQETYRYISDIMR